MYISTSYYRVLVQELRVFRPQNAYDFRVILHDLGMLLLWPGSRYLEASVHAAQLAATQPV